MRKYKKTKIYKKYISFDIYYFLQAIGFTVHCEVPYGIYSFDYYIVNFFDINLENIDIIEVDKKYTFLYYK